MVTAFYPKSGSDGKIAIGFIPDLSGTYQPLGSDLTAIEALSGTGFAKRTATDTWSIGALVLGDIPNLDSLQALTRSGWQSSRSRTAEISICKAIGCDKRHDPTRIPANLRRLQ